MKLTFEEAVFGVEKEIEYKRKIICDFCNGKGSATFSGIKKCSVCNGNGVINVEHQTPLGRVVSRQTCNYCNGKGKKIIDPCYKCFGTGFINKKSIIKVKVPAGIDNEQQVRLVGKGEAGINGGAYGDLYVVFYVTKSNMFIRKGTEIYYEIFVNFIQLSLGDEIMVPTIYGDVKLKIPAGTQTGTNFRLRGKGIPYINSKRCGDQHIKVNVIIPKKLNFEQKKILKEFAKISNYDINFKKNNNFFNKIKNAFKNNFIN